MTPRIEAYEWASELASEDLAIVARLFNEVWAEWVPGERPVSEAAFVDLDRFTAHPERMVRRLARDPSGVVVGWGQVSWREGPGACNMRVLVDPPHRRRGVGRALGAALADVARAAGRTGVTIEAVAGGDAETILQAAGFAADLSVEQNRTDPRTVPIELLEQWRKAGEAAAGYSLVTSRWCRPGTPPATSPCCGSTGPSGSRRSSDTRAGTCPSPRYPDACTKGSSG